MIKTTIGWRHPIDEAGQWDGPNDSGIEHFRGDPLWSLAREICQNSLDAACNENSVEVQFRVYRRKTAEIPNVLELRDAVSRCCDSAKDDKRALEIFRAAQDLLNKPDFQVLEIIDSNTTGIKGPAERGTPFHSFMKARGQSVKGSTTASGSYGIGKSAPYAVSGLRTVIVSSVYKNDAGAYEQLTQGKAILMSHQSDDQKIHQGTGFWGVKEENCAPIQGDCHPAWLAKTSRSLKDCTDTDTGTKLSILGFDGGETWHLILKAAIAANFFGAIQRGKLVVRLVTKHDDVEIIDANTIKTVFDDSHQLIEKALEAHSGNGLDQFRNSARYLNALTQPDECRETQQLHLKKCVMYLTVSENEPKKVCFVRNGMFITDSLEVTGLKSFSEFKEFSAVVECASEEGIRLLRDMEPPRHDNFEPERLPQDRKKTGEQALKSLAKWIRDELKKHAKDEVKEITTIDELKAFFADDADQGSGDGPEEVNPFGEIRLNARPIRKVGKKSSLSGVSALVQDQDEAQEDLQTSAFSPDDNQSDLKSNDLLPPTKATFGDSQQFPIRQLRQIAVDSVRRRISFSSSKATRIALRFSKAGADFDVALSVGWCDAENVDGHVELNALAGERSHVTVEFTEAYEGAVKVVAYEIRPKQDVPVSSTPSAV